MAQLTYIITLNEKGAYQKLYINWKKMNQIMGRKNRQRITSLRTYHDLDAGSFHCCLISIQCLLQSKSVGDKLLHIHYP